MSILLDGRGRACSILGHEELVLLGVLLVSGIGFGVWGLGFGVKGLGFRGVLVLLGAVLVCQKVVQDENTIRGTNTGENMIRGTNT